jgi:hypothetical protein
MKRSTLKFNIYLIFLCLISVLVFCGCTNTYAAQDDSFTLFKFSNEDIRFKLKGTLIHEHPLFTFDYPSSFIRVNTDDEILLNMRVTEVSFRRPVQGDSSNLPETFLSVNVQEPGLWSDSNAKTTIANIITYHVSDDEFRILENTEIDISDIKGKYLEYSYHQPAKEGFGYSPIPAHDSVVRFACFDYEGFVWRMYISCVAQESEQCEVYFQRLLGSFKILEK